MNVDENSDPKFGPPAPLDLSILVFIVGLCALCDKDQYIIYLPICFFVILGAR